MNVAALASTSHQPGLFDMVASPWFSVRVGGSKPPGSYTAYCPNVNLGGVARPSRHDRPPQALGRLAGWRYSQLGSPKPNLTSAHSRRSAAGGWRQTPCVERGPR